MISSLIKLILVNVTLLTLLCSSLTFAANQTLPIQVLNISGDYENRPVVGNYFYDEKYFQGFFPADLTQLMALFEERKRAKAYYEKMIQEKRAKLKMAHREMLMKRSVPVAVHVGHEEKWSLDITRNISDQALLSTEYDKKMQHWDSENGLFVIYVKRGDRKYLSQIKFQKEVGSVFALAY